jgi:hypothetical protein
MRRVTLHRKADGASPGPDRREDQVHSLTPDHSHTVLLILDMISDFDFPDGTSILRAAKRIAPRTSCPLNSAPPRRMLIGRTRARIRGGLMADENASLLARVQDRLRRGVLPTQSALHSFAGKGSGKVCAVCDKQIRAPDVEFELEFARSDTLGRTTLYLHARCNAMWDDERARVQTK